MIFNWLFQKVWIILIFLNQFFILFPNCFTQLFLLLSLVFGTLIDKVFVKVCKLGTLVTMIDLFVPSSLETIARGFMKQVGFFLTVLHFILLPETIFDVGVITATSL